MADNNYKEFHMRTPVENHAAAAWADQQHLKDDSCVNLPDELQIIDAKEFVDENHK